MKVLPELKPTARSVLMCGWYKEENMVKKLPAVLWLTGLSGSGKSTLAEELAKELASRGVELECLDGDVVRDIFPATGFTKAERDTHIKRMGFIASLLEKHEVTAVCTFVSPYRDTRDMVRAMCRNFIEIYISTPFEECERRDVKGLYAKARRGEITHFTGLDDPYEEPLSPEIVIDTTNSSIDDAVNKIIHYINQE